MTRVELEALTATERAAESARLAAALAWNERLAQTAQRLGNPRALAAVRSEHARLLARQQALAGRLTGSAVPRAQPPVPAPVPLPAARVREPEPPVKEARVPISASLPPPVARRAPIPPGDEVEAAPLPFSVDLARPSRWQARPLLELETEREVCELWLSENESQSEQAALEYNAWGCTYRGAALERTRWPGSQDAWRATLAQFQAQHRALFAHRFAPHLQSHIELEPAQWQARATAYHLTVWLLDYLERLEQWDRQGELEPGRRELAPVLAGLATGFQVADLTLRPVPDEARAPEARTLLERTRLLAARIELGAHAEGDPTTPISAVRPQLTAPWAALEARLAHQRTIEARLGELRRLAESPQFGPTLADRERLQQLCFELLGLGVLPNEPRFRDPLLPRVALLEDAPGLNRLVTEIMRAQERLERRQPPTTEVRHNLSSEETAMLYAVLPHTHDQVCLMVGGTDDGRGPEIEALLRLRELRWPHIEFTDSNLDRIENQIRKADVRYVLMNRFNSIQIKTYKRFCDLYEKTLIVLPVGLGRPQLVRAFFLTVVIPQPLLVNR